MSKQTFLQRYSLIIRRLEKGPATWEQISAYLQRESELQGLDYNIAKRTFQREIKAIFTEFGYEIVNEKKGDKRYFIKSRPEETQHSQRLLEAYQTINAIEATTDNKDYIFFETRKANGSEHFNGFLYAIKNKRIVSFTHTKYWDDIETKRIVHPLALKESQGRWYIIAIDTKDNKLKTFGLDRISNVEISKTSFRNKYTFDIKEMFAHSFGIINDENKKPSSVRLSFTYEQGQYIKNYPLHQSQKIISEDDDVIIELNISITYDLIMELLSYGEELTVISPVSLINQIKKIYSFAIAKYNK